MAPAAPVSNDPERRRHPPTATGIAASGSDAPPRGAIARSPRRSRSRAKYANRADRLRQDQRQRSLVTVVMPHDVSFPSTIRIAMDEKDTQPTELAWDALPPSAASPGGRAPMRPRNGGRVRNPADFRTQRRRAGRGDPVLVPRDRAGARRAGEGEVIRSFARRLKAASRASPNAIPAA